ncbi:MAG TPA: aminotransferase class III-fold pyridoxal phosphate-dependent enzyme, partial [Bryobacteraceae bacterium]
MAEFDLTPRRVPLVEHSRWRRIATEIPAPDSIPVLEKLIQFEPRAMTGLPPIVWDRALDFQVFDKYGNSWIDFSSGVLVTNAGHSHPKIVAAIVEQAQSGLIHNYCFPQEPRARLVERLASLLPDPLKKIFLLTTGSETIECAIKLC